MTIFHQLSLFCVVTASFFAFRNILDQLIISQGRWQLVDENITGDVDITDARVPDDGLEVRQRCPAVVREARTMLKNYLQKHDLLTVENADISGYPCTRYSSCPTSHTRKVRRLRMFVRTCATCGEFRDQLRQSREV